MTGHGRAALPCLITDRPVGLLIGALQILGPSRCRRSRRATARAMGCDLSRAAPFRLWPWPLQAAGGLPLVTWTVRDAQD